MKNIRIIKYVFTLSIAMVLYSGCDSILDVQPDSEIGDAQYWQTESDARSAVAGIYNAMQDAYSTKQFLWGEFRSDNFAANPGAENPVSAQLTGNQLNDQLQSVGSWSDNYNMILRANLAINNIPNIIGDVNGQLGQAHALRAFAYFDLIRAFGDVPLYLDIITGIEDDIFRSRTSETEILNNVIIPDMQKAEELILTLRDRFQFSLSSVYCLQAEVYMHIKEYALAKEALDKLLATGGFSLVTTAEAYHALFRNEPPRVGIPTNLMENGPELIFSIRYSQEERPGASGIYTLFWPGVPGYFLSENLENKWIEMFPIDSATWHAKYPDFTPTTVDSQTGATIYGDYHRYLQLLEPGKNLGERRFGKYNLANFPRNEDDTDIVVYRYAGMLLLKAEAEVRLGNLQVAVDIINQIRSARDLPGIQLTNFANADELLDAVLDERQFELVAEGKRWWDLIRNDKAVEVMGPINGQGADRLLFPVWFRHLQDNPNLTQTPGY